MAGEPLEVPELVPIFPLPEVVLFPHAILPLHVFEPRYREMMADALAGPRFIAVGLLKPGFEPLYYTRRAPIHATVGLGQILEAEELTNGDYNMLLRGIARAVIEEESSDRPYRIGRLQPVETFCSCPDDQSASLRDELFTAIRGNPALSPDLREFWLRLKGLDLELDQVSDLIAAGLPLEAELRQCMLEEADAFARGTLLLEQIRTLGAVARNYRRVLRPDGQSMN
jgi:Lon protease-like protein